MLEGIVIGWQLHIDACSFHLRMILPHQSLSNLQMDICALTHNAFNAIFAGNCLSVVTFPPFKGFGEVDAGLMGWSEFVKLDDRALCDH
jgi:hypothetical protein